MRHLVSVAGFGLLSLLARSAGAVEANPSNYLTVLKTLKPGDTMNLAPGTYTDQLQISDLNGTPAAAILINGPATAIFTADNCCNTVELMNSSYVTVRGFTVDGSGASDAFGVSAKGGASNFTHHITIDGLTIKGYGAGQQSVGISTKTPTWGWVIRRNRIIGAGTGIYLGNSDGSAAFFDGIVEGNLIEDPEGYCMQIKHQTPRVSRAGQPETDARTIIRDNVFIKTDRPSGDGDRPNLLVGGFPDSGPGTNDRYEIYGNFFYHNPRESLLQASGRVSIHDNIFVDVAGIAILVANHDLPLKLANVYNNTIYAAGTGIRFGNAAPAGDAVIGNLVFAMAGVTGPITNKKDNLELALADAPTMVKLPSTTLGAMDFYPLAAKCTGPALDLANVSGDIARDVDFNGTAKAPPIYRGAYHGSGMNPGWALAAGLKDLPPGERGSDAGVSADGGTVAGDAGDAARGGDTGTGGDTGGCNCTAAGRKGGPPPDILALLAVTACCIGASRRVRRAG